MTISESHWGGNYFNTKTYYNINSHYGQQFYGYIYAYNNDDDDAEETAELYDFKITVILNRRKKQRLPHLNLNRAIM